MEERLQIIIDTREQQPWSFPEDQVVVFRKGLKTADYALVGDDEFAIERKSIDDFVGTVSSGWDRFKRELDRMSEANFPVKVVIIEGDFADIINHRYNHSRVMPKFVMKRISELIMMKVTVMFASNALMATGMCYTVLRQRQRELNGSNDTQDQSQINPF